MAPKAKAEERKWRGELTIQRVVELKTELEQALDQTDRLQLDLSEATQIDMTCLQLLCAGHRTATRRNKQLILAGIEPLLPMLREAGLARHIGCALDCQRSCLWMAQGRSKEEVA